ncbi:MAG: ATP synthase F0 subunit B [Clostridia bacterium]|nr:ATP synthase F0 subunit B [Clostridia bacterium]
MTIQPSLIVWTVLCFAALYFVLKKLLFDPLLEIMDARREKIASVEQAEKEALRLAEEERLRLLQTREAQEAALREQEREKLESLKAAGKEQLEEAKRARFTAVENCRVQAEAALAAAIPEIETAAGQAAERYLSQLFSD